MIQNKLAELKAMRKNKKGFTLVEIIVVLAILGILIAALTPTMLAFIEDARGKAMVAEARVGIVAAQMVYVTELHADSAAETAFLSDPYDNEQFAFLVAEQTADSGTFSDITFDSEGRVDTLTYTRGSTTITVEGGITKVVTS